jgi:hypothetical protein
MPTLAKEKPVGRPKKKGLRPGEEPVYKAIGVRARVEWIRWLEEAAEFCRLDTSKLVDLAVAAYAAQQGFPKKPPPRI